ncbi:MAG: hypothetical protein HRU15_05405 [Planctomycetes bacterium]|nr:hypothetical protein [Planctomycetota bacterium]
MKYIFLILVMAVVIVINNVYASELVIKDVRLGTEFLPGDFDFENTSDTNYNTGSDEFESSIGASAGAIYSWSVPGSSSGWLAGGMFTLRQQAIGDTSDVSSIGFRAIAGYAYALNDRLTFSAEPFIGIGLSDMTVQSTDNVDGFAIDGDLIEYGVNVQSIISMTSEWQALIGVGYVSSTMSLSGGPQSFQSDIDSDGLYASLGISWRWDTSPWTLE